MLDAELERAAGDSRSLQRERGEPLVLGSAGVEELLATIRATRLFEEHGTVEEAELGQLLTAPAAVREHLTGLAPQQFLLLREGELHQRDLGRPSTRSAMMLRRISLVPASIVFPRLRSC